MTDKLQRVLNAAAWVVIGMKKFDPAGLSWLLHSELHCDWLDVPEWVTDKMAVMMLFSCLHMVKYLLDLCQPVSDVASRRHLWSTDRRLLNVPHPEDEYIYLPGGRLSHWLAGWCGTRCRTTWETRQSAGTLSVSI